MTLANLARSVDYDHKTLIVLATVAVILTYDRFTVVNDNRKFKT
jgi:hypothetical protein